MGRREKRMEEGRDQGERRKYREDRRRTGPAWCLGKKSSIGLQSFSMLYASSGRHHHHHHHHHHQTTVASTTHRHGIWYVVVICGMMVAMALLAMIDRSRRMADQRDVHMDAIVGSCVAFLCCVPSGHAVHSSCTRGRRKESDLI